MHRIPPRPLGIYRFFIPQPPLWMGLEVKSWGAYIGFGIIGSLVTFTLSHLFAKLATD